MTVRKLLPLSVALFGAVLLACWSPPEVDVPPEGPADAGTGDDGGITLPEGACALGCPLNHVCNDEGVCVAEPGEELILNVETTELTVRVRNEGALPQVVSCLSDGQAVKVTAHSREREYTRVASIPCDSVDFEVSLRLPRGSYEVVVQDARVAASSPFEEDVPRATNLPLPPFSAFISASEAAKSVVADFRLFEVRGTVLRNGRPPVVDPVACTEQGSAAVIRFHREDAWQKFVVTIPCDAPTFDFVAHVYGSQWTVDVALADGPLHYDRGFDWGIYLPVRDFVTHEALTVGGDLQGLVLDVPSVPLTFNVLLNGETPALLPACDASADPRTRAADVILTDADSGHQHRLQLPCDDPAFSLTTNVFPGRYRVTVSGLNRGTGPTSSLPSEPWSPTGLLDVTQPRADVTFDLRTRKVNVEAWVDGQLAQATSERCDLNPRYLDSGGIGFRHETTGAEFGTAISCDGAFSVSGLEVYEGTYEVTVSRAALHEDGFTLVWESQVTPGVVVDAQTEKIVVDQPWARHEVTAGVRLNGASLPVPADCGEAGWGAKVWLTGNGKSENIVVPCGELAQDLTLSLFPGSYRALLTLHPEHLQALGLPLQPGGFDLPPLVVEGPMRHDFDLVLRTLSGRVLVDGTPIQLVDGCPEWLGSVRFGRAWFSTAELACEGDVGRFSLYAQPSSGEVEVLAPPKPSSHPTPPPSNLPPGSYRVIDRLQLH